MTQWSPFAARATSGSKRSGAEGIQPGFQKKQSRWITGRCSIVPSWRARVDFPEPPQPRMRMRCIVCIGFVARIVPVTHAKSQATADAVVRSIVRMTDGRRLVIGVVGLFGVFTFDFDPLDGDR